MIKYTILQSESLVTLTKLVNKYLLDNWETIGGVSVVYKDSSGTWYYQAMINNKEDIGTRE